MKKHIKSFNEYNDCNLATNLNPKSIKFDGGDGPSATEIPDQYHKTVTEEPKIKYRNNAKKEQEIRKKDRKERSKEYRIAKLMDFQTTDDIIQFAPRKEPLKQ
jgi:hypothetical protein